MLYDKEFLLKLDKSKNKTIYARVTALQFNESPVEQIEGRVTGGSINLDGASALRRTCSLTIVAQEFNYSDYYWGLNTKFKLEIGVQNNVDPTYPDIIWFNQGIYLITSFNTSRSTNNFSISINGKDKMCLLNGEVSGSLEASIDFGSIEEENADGIWTIRKIPIPEIIRNAVHTYAGEPYWNIIINDLDTYGLELLEYRYDIPMYLYRNPATNIFDNVIIENNTSVFYLKNNGSYTPIKLKELDYNHLDLLVNSLTGSPNPQWVYDKTTTPPNGNHPGVEKIGNDYMVPYVFAKVSYGETAGYRTTDLIYPDDLISGIGETLTSILDKIKNMLAEFEYFYDVDGRFVFQKKKSFINTMWTPTSRDENGNEQVMESLMLSSANAYTFSGGELITTFNNNPNLLNMRNDYSVWGARTGASGASIPIHMRYAIDNKPKQYTTIFVDDNDAQLIAYNKKYGTALKGQLSVTYSIEEYDWREIIYRMAEDYYKYNTFDDFELRLINANPTVFPTGQTGYESYYIDIQGFWRQLYYPHLDLDIIDVQAQIDEINGSSDKSIEYWENRIKSLEARISVLAKKLADGSISDAEYSEYVDKRNNLLQARNKVGLLENKFEKLSEKLASYQNDIVNYYYYNYDENGEVVSNYEGSKRWWNRDVFESPETINFWFDFLDTPGELQQFNVQTVGARSKAINDTAIKSIYFRETPTVIFTDNITEDKWLSGYKYIQIPSANMDSMFSISAQGKSAKDKLDEMLYLYGYCIESATINAIPIYYLEPNCRVYIHDDETGLDGDYIVSKITLPLTYNGTMSLTATKAAESLF
jgi:hypothetical protein